MFKGISYEQFRNLMIYQVRFVEDLKVGDEVSIIRKRSTLDGKDTKYSITYDCTVDAILGDQVNIMCDGKVQYMKFDCYGADTQSKDFKYTSYLIFGRADIDAALDKHLFYVMVCIQLELQGITNEFVKEIPILADDIEEAREIFKNTSHFNIKFAEELKAIKCCYRQIT